MADRRPLFALVAAALLGCAPAPAPTSVTGSALPPRDLALLEHMIQLNALHLGIEPHLRDADKMGELARVAGEIAALGSAPVFVDWPKRPNFPHEPARYERFRQDLLRGAAELQAAAESADKGAVVAAYARLDASCTACHKRYSPTY